MKNDDDNLVDKEIQMLARLWQRKRSDKGRYMYCYYGVLIRLLLLWAESAIFTKNLIFVCFLPHYVSLSPEHWFSTTG